MNYIGSKFSILSYIDEVVEGVVKEKKDITFCDIFAGTGVVSKYFKEKGYNIISNDIEYFSYATLKGLIENSDELKFEKLQKKHIDPFICLNGLNGKKGFIYKNYSLGGTKKNEYQRQYFSDDNAKKIDACRIKIEKWKKKKLINEGEYYYLIACLIEAADKVANTASVYEAFLKEMKKSAYKPMIVNPLELIFKNKKYEIYNENSKDLIRKISGDILYLDPPYNNRKYDTNYHILETIALYDNPKIKGKTGTRVENTKKSNYCIKDKAAIELEDLIKNADFKYILLSYNDEGIIPIEKIEEMMKKYGNYKRYEKKHKRFKSDNERTYKKDYTIEYIHCLEKNK
ncbi:MAG: DNA adenine methylase [Bacilli bacterium]|nr:DNA adenine methylase [Bacilli bacterium]